MYELKGAIFSLRDVLVRKQMDANTLEEVVRLLKFLILRGVQPVLVGNTRWKMRSTGQPFEVFLSERVGAALPAFFRGTDFGRKEEAAAMQHVLGQFGWQPQEAVYVGSTELDMRAASNGKMLFLNAEWYARNSPYGFEFSSALDIARFIDCCCLIPDDWFWTHEQDGFRVHSIAPLAEYSRRHPEAAQYSAAAKQAAKFNRGDVRFWGLLMAARLHFSGLAAEANYVAPYPGHRTGSPKMLLTNALKIVSGSLRAQYLDDLIVRHTTADKSQTIRRNGGSPTPDNQLRTIRLRRDPVRTGEKALRYKSPPLGRGKTVLIVDDICTQGNSFECARAFVEATGANAIGVSWLKTPGNDYSQITELSPQLKKPYNAFIPANVRTTSHRMSHNISNPNAPQQIANAFAGYADWDWPSDVIG